MIYTVTFNPALDYSVSVGEIKNGATNRSAGETLSFGGKGVNVSFILRELGAPSVALGFIAGETGDMFEAAVKKTGLTTDFIKVTEGMTRINVKLKGDDETEINGTGPAITDKDIEKLCDKLSSLCEDDTLVLAGSVPPCLAADTYEKIMARFKHTGVRFFVDATGDLLKNTLKHRPFFIKPNKSELEELVGRTLTGDAEVEKAARELWAAGAQNVIVSLGADGALFIDGFGNRRRLAALGGEAVDTVGAGDSMLAGFLAGMIDGYPAAFRLSVAAGGATACKKGLATAEEIYKLRG